MFTTFEKFEASILQLEWIDGKPSAAAAETVIQNAYDFLGIEDEILEDDINELDASSDWGSGASEIATVSEYSTEKPPYKPPNRQKRPKIDISDPKRALKMTFEPTFHQKWPKNTPKRL